MKHAKRHGIERQVTAAGVVEETTAEISKILAPEDFEVISFKDGVLKIEANSASAKSEMQLGLSQKFRRKNTIKRIVFVTKSTSFDSFNQSNS